MFRFILIFLITIFMADSSYSQGYVPTPNDTLISPVLLEGNLISFRVYAPSAREIKLGGPDIPGNVIKPMKKLDNGVWETIAGPVVPGAYRYCFVIDGVQVIDPKNSKTSEANNNTWSLVYAPGSEDMDTRDVPHGSVSEVTYFSKSLNKFRRMHVYTPPGYESGKKDYPVLYLLHGAYDCDDAWSTVGRAGFITDNLIADKKAVPIIIVMPAGHTRLDWFTPEARSKFGRDEFILDFNNDIRPYIESNYRTIKERNSRAIAGLSMGGAHTLNIAIPDLNDYAYIGVFSSGLFQIMDPNYGKSEPKWEDKYAKVLTDDLLKKDLKLFWIGIGKEDFLLATSRATVDLLKKYNFDMHYKEDDGAHTWLKWREYLIEFSQQLFK